MAVAVGCAPAAAETVRLASAEVAKAQRQPPLVLLPLVVVVVAGPKKMALMKYFKNSNSREKRAVYGNISSRTYSDRRLWCTCA